jgi:alpha-1,3-rhamnosyl/mannosyltransferase
LRGFDGVFHGTYNAIPFGCPVPAVVSFYDLSFEHHREDFRVDKLLAWRVQARHAAREARAVVTISRFVSGDLTETYGIDPARIHLAPPSVDPVFGPERASGAEAVLDRLGAPRPYVVALGGPRRRRLDIAVEAWRRLRQAGGTWPLVVVGRQAPATEPGVFHAGVLEDAEWAAVLAGADALCYPTRYEGFGLPALEAAASGTPVVCAPTGPLPEVLGDAAAWCADSTAESVAETLAALLGDPARHQALVDAGLRRAAAAPTWADSAAALVGAYLAAAGT